MKDSNPKPETTPSVYEIMSERTREQIIDAWMEDKLFLQGQVRRLRGIIRELHALHVSSGDLFHSARMDVVLEDETRV